MVTSAAPDPTVAETPGVVPSGAGAHSAEAGSSPRPASAHHQTTDWPVAPIPTAPTPDRTGGHRTPIRWPHHGDLRILTDAGDVFVAATDLHALAEFDTTGHPAILCSTVRWAKNPDADVVEYYTLADAVALLEAASTQQAADLLEWMLVEIPEVLTLQEHDRATRMESFLTAFTVQQAAAILDRDPAVSVGRRALFEHLELIGWAARGLNGVWLPMPAAIRDDWVTVRRVTVRAGKNSHPYPQLYITPAGLAELRRTLHALHPDAPATPPTPETLPI
ncbi:phage antirepressor KilAC domain-containing protein [Microbacterium sp. Mu-80]|uniref:Phage antirepressor KilAC domain-containing protein n=1 Tax=Microbacterium bandirmense TaxID=3122050 RepID=A0ABU8L7P1_9MICO